MRVYKELINKNLIVSHTTYKGEIDISEENYSFKIIFNGYQDFLIGNREIRLYPDSFVLLAPGTKCISRVDLNEQIKTLSISLTQNFVEDFLRSSHMNSNSLNTYKKQQNQLPIQTIYPLKGDMWFTIINLKNQLIRSECSEQLVNEYLSHLLINYYRLYYQEVQQKFDNLNFVRSTTKSEIFNRLILAKEYISNNYNRKFKIEDVAVASCLSTTHLMRTFKLAYGLSTYEYLTQVRLSRSQALLRTGKYSINEIVMLVGFESVSSFISLFKASFNHTPLKFKKLLQQKSSA
ncbi:AraC family transcriptional regulator [Pedobacter boryungensis]|uniref:Helix-turn-helix transcriptional regulator n=1 Tax=Pedobacter boryungensis TaxID=869962 RepID=A0ABX2DGB6_9SPHI|nr:AraC family transcriptional regulator [Pedobacter boryungensis]NQX33072.1 helix-turn-helix transcriptional regulator [Pedobacter boryungensis]